MCESVWLGDGEFGNPVLIEYLDFWGWDYALRQKSNTKIWMRGAKGWQRLDELGMQRGDQWWIGHVVLTEASSYCGLLAFRRSPYDLHHYDPL